MGFLDQFGDLTRDVVVIKNFQRPNEERLTLTAVVQGKKAFFPVEAHVFEGNIIEVLDPRGGVRRHVVDSVEIREGLDLDHIEVRLGGSPT